MATVAAKVLVPFQGDFSQLEAGGLGAIRKLSDGSSGLRNVLLGTTLAIGGAGIAVLDLASKYETSSDRMAARAQITKAQAKAIGDEFLSTGGKSTFSAQAIMDAYGPVAGQLASVYGRALDAREALQFENAAMADSEATGASLADTTAALADVTQTYHLRLNQVSDASDILFGVSTRLNVPIADLTTGVDRLHGKLGDAAPSLRDTGALMAIMGEHGLTGSRALMQVSSGLEHLLGGSKPVNKELADLGVHVYTASGQFVGMDSIIAQLQPKLDKLNDAQRNQALGALFGAGASQAWFGIIQGGAAAFDAAASSIDKAGSAETAAQTATSNLSGEWDRAKSLVMDGAVTIGEVALPLVTNGLQGVLTFTGDVIADLRGVATASSDADTPARSFAHALQDAGSFIQHDLLPPLETFGGWMVDHYQVIEGIGGALAALYVGRKVGGLVGGALDDLKGVVGAGQKLVGLFTGGGSGAASALSKLAPAHVWVDNMVPGLGGGGGGIEPTTAAKGAEFLPVGVAGVAADVFSAIASALALAGLGKEIAELVSGSIPDSLQKALEATVKGAGLKGDNLPGAAAGFAQNLPLPFLSQILDLFGGSTPIARDRTLPGDVAAGAERPISRSGAEASGLAYTNPLGLAADQTAATQGEFTELIKTGVVALRPDVNRYLTFWKTTTLSAGQQADLHAEITREFQEHHIKNSAQLFAVIDNWEAIKGSTGDMATQQSLMDSELAKNAGKAEGSSAEFARDLATAHDHGVDVAATAATFAGDIAGKTRFAVLQSDNFAHDLQDAHEHASDLSSAVQRGAIDTKAFAGLSYAQQQQFLKIWNGSNLTSGQILSELIQANLPASRLPTAIGRLEGSINDAAAAAAELKGHFSVAGAIERGVSGVGGGGGYTAGDSGGVTPPGTTPGSTIIPRVLIPRDTAATATQSSSTRFIHAPITQNINANGLDEEGAQAVLQRANADMLEQLAAML